MDQSKVDTLKKWAKDEVTKYGEGRVFIDFKKKHKQRLGVCKTIKDSEPIKYELNIYWGENLEEIHDSIDEERFKDTVHHEIAHALVGIKVCKHHTHDHLWKEYAEKLGAMPTSGNTRVTFILWKNGTDGSILGKSGTIKLNVFENDDNPHVALEKNSFGLKQPVQGSRLLACPTCHSVWVRKDSDRDHYCSDDGTRVVDISLEYKKGKIKIDLEKGKTEGWVEGKLDDKILEVHTSDVSEEEPD